MFGFKLGLANMKTAITTVLQLCRTHNLGNNSDFTSAYTQPWFAATVSYHCYFRMCWGFPWGSGARGQACWAVPQTGSEHAWVTGSQARCMPPWVTSSQATASLYQWTCHQRRTCKRVFRKKGEIMLSVRFHFKASKWTLSRMLVTFNSRHCLLLAWAWGERPTASCVASGNHSKTLWLQSHGSR